MKWRLVLILSIIGLILSGAGLIIILITFAAAHSTIDKYSVVLDARETSTRMYLFRWKDEAYRTNAELEHIGLYEMENGLSNYVDQPFRAYRDIYPTLASLIGNIPSESKSKSPVYLGLTSGLQLALIDNPVGMMHLLEVLRRNFFKSELLLEFPNERIRFLSGSEVGLYNWIAVNIVMGRISANSQAEAFATMGSLEMGDSSVHIAFAPITVAPTEDTSIDFHSIKLYNKEYRVYSHSFLCFGRKEFGRRLKAFLVNSITETTIDHPCLLNGFILANQTSEDIYSSPCVLGNYADGTFPHHLTRLPVNGSLIFTGTGNTRECKNLIRKQFNTLECTVPPCSFNNIFQPGLHGAFYAYSGFSHAINYLFRGKSSGFTIKEVQDAVEAFCVRPWSEVSKEPFSKYMTNFCLDGLYILILLDYFGFKSDAAFGQIIFENHVDYRPIHWSLGFMLEQSSFLPNEIADLFMPVSLAATLGSIFVLTILLSTIGVTYVRFRKLECDSC